MRKVDVTKSRLRLANQLHEESEPGFHLEIQFRDSDNNFLAIVPNGAYGKTHNFSAYITDPVRMLRAELLAENWPGPVEFDRF